MMSTIRPRIRIGQSIADLVDNCYDADASSIDVRIGKDSEDKLFVRVRTTESE